MITKNYITHVAEQLKNNSVLTNRSCWYLTPLVIELIERTEITNESLHEIFPPYDRMALEFDMRVETKTDRKDIALSICACVDSLNDIEYGEYFGVVIFIKTRGSRWSRLPYEFTIPHSSLAYADNWLSSPDGDLFMFATSPQQDRPYVSVFDDVTDFHNMDNELRMSFLIVGEKCLLALLGLMTILRCDNAPTEVIPAPKFLNRKRAKKKKPLIPEYRTLHVTDHTARNSHPATGTYASPRTHWRRGHIRNQPTAKGIVRRWIKPTIIGGGIPSIPEIVVT